MHCQAMNLAANILYPCILKLESLEKKKKMVRIYNEVFFQFYFVKAVSQPLRGMELQEKEAEKDAKNIVKLIIKSPKRKSAY